MTSSQGTYRNSSLNHAQNQGKLNAEIEAYRTKADEGIVSPIDDDAEGVFRRLLKDEPAARSFSDLIKDRNIGGPILESCIKAVQLNKNFNEIIEREQRIAANLDASKSHADILMVFLQEMILSNAPDGLSAHSPSIDRDIETARLGLKAIHNIVETRRIMARETPLRLGKTRKSGIENAQDNAAIGWIAGCIKQRTGKPHARKVAAIARAALGIRPGPEGPLSDREVSDIMRRRPEKWRSTEA